MPKFRNITDETYTVDLGRGHYAKVRPDEVVETDEHDDRDWPATIWRPVDTTTPKPAPAADIEE